MTLDKDQSAAVQEKPVAAFPARFLLAALDFYRRWLSPALHSLSPWDCKFLPTCSEYASLAIAMHGPVRGGWLAMRRLLRCHPFGRGGLDPVPPAPNSSHIPQQPLP
jgi:putative membrane protein insertion efficiency factor